MNYFMFVFSLIFSSYVSMHFNIKVNVALVKGSEGLPRSMAPCSLLKSL